MEKFETGDTIYIWNPRYSYRWKNNAGPMSKVTYLTEYQDQDDNIIYIFDDGKEKFYHEDFYRDRNINTREYHYDDIKGRCHIPISDNIPKESSLSVKQHIFAADNAPRLQQKQLNYILSKAYDKDHSVDKSDVDTIFQEMVMFVKEVIDIS
jgi:hypothetical protein